MTVVTEGAVRGSYEQRRPLVAGLEGEPGGAAAGVAAGGALRAAITFAGEFAGTPINYVDVEPPAGVPRRFPTRQVQVALSNGRGVEGLSLAREGFVLRRDEESLLDDFYDEGALRGRYYSQIERLVRQCTGARRVIVFDHTHRSSAVVDRLPGGADAAVDQAHNDYSLASGPERVREVLARLAPDEDVSAAMAGRYAIVNVWRPINGPVEQLPLAVCDQRTVEPEDFAAAELRWANRTGYVAVLRHDPRQQWVHFPRMCPSEALVFSCFDSAGQGGRHFGAHTAFRDPTSLPGARPRESLEVRTVALF
jgi:hypothetical protein